MPNTAELVKETIVVQRSGQWGPQVNGVYYGFNNPLQASDFETGKTYNVLVKIGKATAKYPEGKKFICQIIGGGTVATDAASTCSIAVKTPAPTTTNAYIKNEQDRGNSQKLGGLFHDAAQVVAALVTSQGLNAKAALETFSEVVNGIIDIRDKMDK